jgi:hypothetical protein
LPSVGASLLAKNVNDNACFLNERGACEFFASKLAPTKKAFTDWHCGKPARHSSLLATQFGRLIKILILINQ